MAIGHYFETGASHAPAHNEGRLASEAAGRMVTTIAGLVRSGKAIPEIIALVEQGSLVAAHPAMNSLEHGAAQAALHPANRDDVLKELNGEMGRINVPRLP